LAQVAVAQICEGPIGHRSVCFDALQKSARDVLAEVLVRYISEIGSISHDVAELAGRTKPNVFDVLSALDDLGTSMRDVMEYAAQAEEVPFAKPLPQFPVRRVPDLPPSFGDAQEEPPSHIPRFLPALPDQHTYRQTPTYEGRELDIKGATQTMYKNNRQADKALLGLLERTDPTAPANYLQVRNSKLWENKRAGRDSAYRSNLDKKIDNPFLLAPLRPPASASAEAAAGTSSNEAGPSNRDMPTLAGPDAALEDAKQDIMDTDDAPAMVPKVENDTGEALTVQPPQWHPRTDRAPLKFSIDYAARARRVSRTVRDVAPSSSRKRGFQMSGHGDDPEKESRQKRAKAILSGVIGLVIEEGEGTAVGATGTAGS